MRRFTELFRALDATTRTSEKLVALERYFAEVPPEDGAWALHFLVGRRLRRLVSTTRLRAWVAELSGHPPWLVEECYQAVGDLAETLALLLPEPAELPTDEPLHRLVETRLLPLRDASEEGARELLEGAWATMDTEQRLVWNKILTGGFRVGVARSLVARALASVAGIPQAVVAHRLMGRWTPSAEAYRRLLDPETAERDPAQPYPFFLASPIDLPAESSAEPGAETVAETLAESLVKTLGEVGAWLAEWKWDGIRAQLIRRGPEPLLWSRGEEMLGDRFPELVEAAARLPAGVVLDGEILAWSPEGAPGEGPQPFSALQRRIGRKRVGPKLLAEVPVRFLAYDLLERGGEDLRKEPVEGRRQALAAVLEGAGQPRLGLSPEVTAASWRELAALREGARERRVEGLMLKRRGSPYRAGRPRGDWWKWKVDPLTCDAVLLYAQRGHGRRASLYTDYTFGVWRGDELVPIAKAYSGLTDREIRRVDHFVRRNTRERFGPVRSVAPELVFELAFDAIQPSPRHKSGIALRFPRMVRRREDKPPEEADTLEDLLRLLEIPSGAGSGTAP